MSIFRQPEEVIDRALNATVDRARVVEVFEALAADVCAWCGVELVDGDPWCLCAECLNEGGGDA